MRRGYFNGGKVRKGKTKKIIFGRMEEQVVEDVGARSMREFKKLASNK